MPRLRAIQRLSTVAIGGASILAIGCGDSSAPAVRDGVRVVFMDQGATLNYVQSGSAPIATDLHNITPFATTPGSLIFVAHPVVHFERGGLGDTPKRIVDDSGGLRRFDPATGAIDTLPITFFALGTAGAVSPDGRKLAYAAIENDSVQLVILDLETGKRSAVNLSARGDQPAAPQAILNTPVYSPSGDSVAFLLPNPVAMQLLILEVRTGRVEVHPVPVPVSTFYQPLPGWPRWTARDQAIRFLVRVRTDGVAADSFAVLRVYPREIIRPADAIYSAALPDSIPVDASGIYSFDASGNTVAFEVQSGDRQGIVVMRSGQRIAQPMLLTRDLQITYPVLVP